VEVLSRIKRGVGSSVGLAHQHTRILQSMESTGEMSAVLIRACEAMHSTRYSCLGTVLSAHSTLLCKLQDISISTHYTGLIPQKLSCLHTTPRRTHGPLELLRLTRSRTIQHLPCSHLKSLNHLISNLGCGSRTQCRVERIRELIINHQIDLCLHPRWDIRCDFLWSFVAHRTRFVGERTQCPARAEVGEDRSIARRILRGVRAIVVVFYHCGRDGGVGLSADRFDNEVGGCAVDTTVEGFAHYILVSHNQFCFFRPCLAFSIRQGLLGDVGGDAEWKEFVVALDVGNDRVESFRIVRKDSGCC